MEATAIKKYGAEALGTFVLTLFGCGSAAIAGATLGTLGIAFAMFTQGDASALSQVWVFIVAPLVGAALAALIFAAFKSKAEQDS